MCAIASQNGILIKILPLGHHWIHMKCLLKDLCNLLDECFVSKLSSHSGWLSSCWSCPNYVENYDSLILSLIISSPRFDEKEHVSGVNNVKSSIQKGIRTKLLEQYPYIHDYLDQIVPKKELRVAKWSVILSCSILQNFSCICYHG